MENLFVLGVELLRNVGLLVHDDLNAMIKESRNEREDDEEVRRSNWSFNSFSL